jgi:undecaprenyl-diphosphatase
MFAAAGYKLVQNYEVIESSQITTLLIGNVVAFIVALIAIKTFISFVTKYGFKVFGYYRIVVGTAIIIMLAMGYDLSLI